MQLAEAENAAPQLEDRDTNEFLDKLKDDRVSEDELEILDDYDTVSE